MKLIRITYAIACAALLLAVGQSIAETPAVKPPSAAATAPAAPSTDAPAPDANAAAPADPAVPDANTDPSAADSEGGDELSIGEVPAVETEELTPEMARKALDAYVMVHEKYKDSPLENYDDLQAFVDKDPKGKDFENDVKTFGFKDVNDWNLAITTLSFAYTNVVDDQTGDIKQQIEEINANTDMAQDMKDRMIKSLKAMIPSENNRKIVDELIKDAAYSEKIKLLETTAE
jgi:hypothetical protein